MYQTKERLERLVRLSQRGLHEITGIELKKLILKCLVFNISNRIDYINSLVKFFNKQKTFLLDNSYSLKLMPKSFIPSFKLLDRNILSLKSLLNKLFTFIYVIERELHNLTNESPKATQVTVQPFDYEIVENVFKCKLTDDSGGLGLCLKLLTNNCQEEINELLESEIENRKESFKETINDTLTSLPIVFRLSVNRIRNSLITALFSLYTLKKIFCNRYKIFTLLKTSASWLNSHLILPVKTILKEVFLNETPQIVSLTIVKEASESLKRMVQNFTGNFDNSVPARDISISSISKAYENELNKPIKNMLFGDLLQLMLIQVQFVKLQGLKAMEQIDRLLRENQFNTQLLTLLPGLLALYFGYYGVKFVVRSFNDREIRFNSKKKEIKMLMMSLGIELSRQLRTDEDIKVCEGKVSYLVLKIIEEIEDEAQIFSLSLTARSEKKEIIQSLSSILLRNGYSRNEQNSIFSLVNSVL